MNEKTKEIIEKETWDWREGDPGMHEWPATIYTDSERREGQGGITDFESVPEAIVASCAPEALRMLLAMEYAAERQTGPDAGMDECYFCAALPWEKHGETCKWLLLMKKAGLR